MKYDIYFILSLKTLYSFILAEPKTNCTMVLDDYFREKRETLHFISAKISRRLLTVPNSSKG